MLELMSNIGLLILILGSSAWITNAYGRGMYNKCDNCGTLNAKRRRQCRKCGTSMTLLQSSDRT